MSPVCRKRLNAKRRRADCKDLRFLAIMLLWFSLVVTVVSHRAYSEGVCQALVSQRSEVRGRRGVGAGSARGFVCIRHVVRNF